MKKRLWMELKIMASYILPFFPHCPSVGKLEDGDCIFVQSFGRNSISDRNLGKTLRMLRQKATATTTSVSYQNECMFRHLKARKFDPGEANYALAYRVMALWSKKNLPAIIQWEVAYAIWDSNPKCYKDFRDRISCLWPPENGYYSSWKVGIDSCIIMEDWRLCRPIEICHPAMKARVVGIFWRLGVKIIVEGEDFRGLSKNRLWIWDCNSIQSWTRRFFSLRHPIDSWLAREVLVRAQHLWKGWVTFIPPR